MEMKGESSGRFPQRASRDRRTANVKLSGQREGQDRWLKNFLLFILCSFGRIIPGWQFSPCQEEEDAEHSPVVEHAARE